MSKPRFYYGWYIVLCGFLGHSIRMGLGQQTFGFFFKPMIAELAWSRTILTGGLVTRYLVLALLAPIVGFAEDKYGPRFLMAGSAIILGISMLLLSQTTSLWQFVLFFGVIGAFGIPGLAYGVINPTLAKWFIRKRGLAIGISTAGINVGSMALTPIILFLITQYGWRTAWLILGFLPWIVVVAPSLIWLRRQPEDMGLRPDGANNESCDISQPTGPHQKISTEATVQEVSWTPRAALRTRTFWLLVAASMSNVIAFSGDTIHRIPYMTDMGFSDAAAGTTLIIYSIASFCAKFLWGFLADRMSVRFLAVAMLVGGAVGQALLIDATNIWQLYLGYGVTYGLSMGALFVIEPVMWANYFGRQFQGSIRGLANPFTNISAVIGPLFAAFVYDAFGSYKFAFAVFTGLYLVAALFMQLAQPPKPVPVSESLAVSLR